MACNRAKAGHGLLYLLLIGLPITGWYRVTHGRAGIIPQRELPAIGRRFGSSRLIPSFMNMREPSSSSCDSSPDGRVAPVCLNRRNLAGMNLR